MEDLDDLEGLAPSPDGERLETPGMRKERARREQEKDSALQREGLSLFAPPRFSDASDCGLMQITPGSLPVSPFPSLPRDAATPASAPLAAAEADPPAAEGRERRPSEVDCAAQVLAGLSPRAPDDEGGGGGGGGGHGASSHDTPLTAPAFSAPAPEAGPPPPPKKPRQPHDGRLSNLPVAEGGDAAAAAAGARKAATETKAVAKTCTLLVPEGKFVAEEDEDGIDVREEADEFGAPAFGLAAFGAYVKP